MHVCHHADNGDTDPGINSFVSQNWSSALGFAEKESWRPWTLDGQQRMGGYVTRYEGGFDFLTIRGSGYVFLQTLNRGVSRGRCDCCVSVLLNTMCM